LIKAVKKNPKAKIITINTDHHFTVIVVSPKVSFLLSFMPNYSFIGDPQTT